MEYLRQTGELSASGDSCLFCGLARQRPSSETLILETYATCFLVLNAFPYTSGHVMVAPFRHQESLLGGGSEERAEIQAALERVRRALSREYGPDGFNIGANLGRAAGAGVPGHVHWHVVPRWQGDTNFVPVLATTRVIPEALPETYSRLLRSLASEDPEGVAVTGRGHAA
jgi:ATP adenylyltransferase